MRADRPRRTRSVAEGSVSQAPGEAAPAPARTRSSDAPWHNPVPAHDEPGKPAAEPDTEEPAVEEPAVEEPAPGEKTSETPPAESAGQDGDGA
ncbi:hypothetical protein ACFVFS_35825 [Kitasatospora sp. NPDC057692]|uniref:hypothetical protein n=1 Tax=Kitasatospora sp. NPDC057692 TaxID=3346215 RepID=UPI0036D005DA